jgi:GMP synthase-like glutamine amidotransferase
MKKIRIAILDLYDGQQNEGMRCIREMLVRMNTTHQQSLEWVEFEVRNKEELPSLEFDIYLSTGGPGSPLESEGMPWDNAYFKWLSDLVDWNNTASNINKKYAFFICHSYQLACRYFGLGHVTKRKSTAFGVFPMHRIADGLDEPVFKGLNDPFYGVDSRDFQVIQPQFSRIEEMGAAILCIEKERPHVDLERAIMAIRFNAYMVGTQFHPEADAQGMSMYLQRDDKKKTVIENHGQEKWESMIEQLNDPEKISMTNSHVLPNFILQAIANINNPYSLS